MGNRGGGGGADSRKKETDVKSVDPDQLDAVPGRRLDRDQTFCFRCHPAVSCFNRCCRNLNLYLYPYDVLRLKRSLGISSDEFLDRHVEVVLRPGSAFPSVLLSMAENAERTCPFLSADGCRVYADRPDTCRSFPVEVGSMVAAGTGRSRAVYFLRPPDFCQGQHETRQWTVSEWMADQQAVEYQRMTLLWSDLMRLFQDDPWGAEGPEGPRAKMAFMATYNLDRFRDFVFNSSFLKRYRVKPDLLRRLRGRDEALLRFGFDWVRWTVFGQTVNAFKPRR
jgi:Fe-S-cluster containining protein